MSTIEVGLALDGPAERVGEHQPALGIGVGDLDRRAVVRREHVAGPERRAADHVLRERGEAGDPDRQPEPGDGEHRLHDGGGAGHVLLHRRHAGRGLDGQAAGVEGDALADQRQVQWSASLGAVVELDQPRRSVRPGADAEDAAAAELGEPGLVVAPWP